MDHIEPQHSAAQCLTECPSLCEYLFSVSFKYLFNCLMFFSKDYNPADLSDHMSSVYDEVKRTAKEFNTRGDLHAGANIAAFLHVADAMMVHGSV